MTIPRAPCTGIAAVVELRNSSLTPRNTNNVLDSLLDFSTVGQLTPELRRLIGTGKCFIEA